MYVNEVFPGSGLEKNYTIRNMTAVFQLKTTPNYDGRVMANQDDGEGDELFHVSKEMYRKIAEGDRHCTYRPEKFHALIMKIYFSGCAAKARRAIKKKFHSSAFEECYKISASLFLSGKVALTGGKCQRDCQLAALQVCRRLNIAMKLDEGFKSIYASGLRIVNIVGVTQLPFQIAIEKLYNDYRCANNQASALSKHESVKAGCRTPALNAVRVRYEPTIFTGASIKFAPPGSVRNTRKHRDNIKPFPTFLMFINGKVIMTGNTTEQEVQESFKKFYSLIQFYKRTENL